MLTYNEVYISRPFCLSNWICQPTKLHYLVILYSWMGYCSQGKGLPDYLGWSVSEGFCSMELANTKIQSNLPFSIHTCFNLYFSDISFPLPTPFQRLRVWSKDDFVLFYCYKKNETFRKLNLKLVIFLCSGPIILRSFKQFINTLK